MTRKITMKEIAKLANVSQPTVSRVINNHKGVNEEVAKRVRKVIEEVGYVPNKAAQTLKRNHSHIIGVSVTEIDNPYFVELIDYLESEARKKGYNILFHNSKYNPMTEWENIQNFIARQVDGIIIVPTGDHNLQRIGKLNIPTVSITQNWEYIDSVGLNHMRAGKLVAENFIRSGHETFGYIGVIPDDKFLGFKSGLYENGFEFNMDNFVQTEETSTDHFLIRKNIEEYFDKIDQLNFTCAFTKDDIIAFEFMKVAQERNIRIPEDVSLIGFDDTYLAKLNGISSIHQPVEEMVKTTLDILLNRIENEMSGELISIQSEPTLIVRNTSRYKRE